jgi:glycerol-1-phosphate dehydrogenase [NAD(P)+]
MPHALSRVSKALAAARETRRLELGSGVLGRTPQIFRELFRDRPVFIVADTNSLRVAGETVLNAFRAAGHPCAEPFVYTDPALLAEYSCVTQLEQALGSVDAVPVAVGSGTINDLVKLVAHRLQRPYLVVATAASMDGYTAFGASITFQGSKQTFACPAPAGVVADLEVIAGAPKDMTSAGYADLLAKITAGADWLLADALGEEPIAIEAWNIVQGGLRAAVADPAGVRSGDREAIRQLTEGLLLGGFAMQSAQSSRPASGAEHQFSHLWDMQHHTFNGEAPSHGFKVAIGTLAVSALYEHLLQLPLDKFDVAQACSRWPKPETLPTTIRRVLGIGKLAEKAIEESGAKHSTPAALRKQLETVARLWPHLKLRLREQLLPFSELQRKLNEAGAPTEPEQIGISRQRLRDSFLQAYYIRRRFTVLDLAARTGLLESSLQALFGPEGRWPINEPKASKTAVSTS